MNIGDNIRRIRKTNSLTMKELGEKIGISEQGIGNYERGDRKPDFEILNNIAEVLDCKLFDLLGVDTFKEAIKGDSQSYYLQQYLSALGYEITPDIKDGYHLLKSKNGEYEIAEGVVEELITSTQSFIQYKLYEITNKSRKIRNQSPIKKIIRSELND